MHLALIAAPGIGSIVLAECALKRIPYSRSAILPLKTQDLVILQIDEAFLTRVFKLRTAEDIFAVIYSGVKVERPTDLRRLTPASLKEDILACLKYLPRRRKKKRTTNFWVFVKQDVDRSIHRKHISGKIGDYVSGAFRNWVPREPADVELWAFYSEQRVTLGLRLTDISFRQRRYRTAERPGSLRPTLASALIVLSNPSPDDYFLDPMCGVGTIPIERALWGQADFVGGGDIDTRAIGIAKENAASARCNIELNSWDGTDINVLGRHIGKVSRIVTNLPFGKKFGADADLHSLYLAAVSCWGKTLSSDGSMLLLTSQRKTMERALKEIGLSWQIARSFSVQGIRSAAYSVCL